MGLNGLVRRAFPSFETMAEFEQTETYREIHRMLAELRKQPPPKDVVEDTKVITIRIPQSLHEFLRIEAFEHHTTHEQTVHLQAGSVHRHGACADRVAREKDGGGRR